MELVASPDQIRKAGIRRVLWLKNWRPKRQESNSSRVQIIRLTMREPTIGPLVSRVQQEHQSYAQQQVTGTNPSWPFGRSFCNWLATYLFQNIRPESNQGQNNCGDLHLKKKTHPESDEKDRSGLHDDQIPQTVSL